MGIQSYRMDMRCGQEVIAMKIVYEAPEAEILCFAPVEELAKSPIVWNGAMTAGQLGAGGNSSDMEATIPDNPEGSPD